METDAVIRRTLLLLQTRRFAECATFFQSLDAKGFFFNVLPHISMEILLSNIPESIEVIEASLLHVCTNSDEGATSFVSRHSEAIAMRIVRHYATVEDERKGVEEKRTDRSVGNVVRVLSLMDPMVKKYLLKRKRILDSCLNDMGRHTMTESSSNGAMTPLAEALRSELEVVAAKHKAALKRVDALGLTSNRLKGRSGGRANSTSRAQSATRKPSVDSHQRLMEVNQRDVEDRLYKNTEIYNAIEENGETATLSRLRDKLKERIDMDKNLLLHFTQLRKESNAKKCPTDDPILSDKTVINGHQSVPPDLANISAVLKNYIRGFVKVLEAMRVSRAEIDRSGSSARVDPSAPTGRLRRARTFDDNNNDDGEEEDEDDVLLDFNPRMEGICTLHRRRTVKREGRSARKRGEKGGDAGVDEASRLRRRLEEANARIAELEARCSSSDGVGRDSVTHTPSSVAAAADSARDVTVRILTKRYENLFASAEDTTLESLEALEAAPADLERLDDLKTKLLFSVIVLSFRAAVKARVELWTRVRVALQLPVVAASVEAENPGRAAVEDSLEAYLQRTVDSFDLSAGVQEVCDQVWQTLYDFPSLKKSASLVNFVEDSVRVAWALVTVTPSATVEFGEALFDPNRHTRHPASDVDDAEIKQFLWPTLVDENDGSVRSRGVVVT